MKEGSGDVPMPQQLHQPVTVFAAVTLPAPSSSSATNGMESATTPDSDDDSDATGPPEETPERGTETRQEADETDRTWPKKPEQPETPEHSALADETTEATEDEAAQDVDAFKPNDGCATPPPPAHDSEGYGGDGSSTHWEKPKPPAGASGKRPDVAAAKPRLLAFRSFSRDMKGKKSGDAATPQGRVPSAGEHGRPADGKAWEEAEHKEKGKARWKRLWK